MTTPLPRAPSLPAYLPRAVSTRDDVNSLRMLGDEVDERLALTFGPDRIRLPLECKGLDDCQRVFYCTPKKIKLSRVSLSK